MKQKKIITYVLTLSTQFPKTHYRKGEPTNFINSIAEKTKVHTIRGNYALWEKRFKKIDKGEAILSVRSWCGKPYASKQIEHFVFDKSDGIGVQLLHFNNGFSKAIIGDGLYSNQIISKNDGLTLPDFEYWFEKYDLSEPMAVIHFTNFRY